MEVASRGVYCRGLVTISKYTILAKTLATQPLYSLRGNILFESLHGVLPIRLVDSMKNCVNYR